MQDCVPPASPLWLYPTFGWRTSAPGTWSRSPAVAASTGRPCYAAGGLPTRGFSSSNARCDACAVAPADSIAGHPAASARLIAISL